MISMAYVAHPHGIKGEAELRFLNPDAPDVLADGIDVWLFPSSEKSMLPKSGEKFRIHRLRVGNKVICQFVEIKDRTQLEGLIPFEIRLPRESFPDLSGEEFYLSDLIGFTVCGPEGQELGKLVGLSDNGMQELFEVRLHSGESVTLPYVEAFFPDIDIEDRKITMVSPEYIE